MPLPPTPSLHLLPLALLATTLACTERPQSGSDLGRELALHLCPIQPDCGCDDDLLIPNCEAEVERTVAESERRALAAGLTLDRACVQETLDTLDGLAACGLEGGLSCNVYSAQAEEGEPCEHYDFVPTMTECRSGLQCLEGRCRHPPTPPSPPMDPPPIADGEPCTEPFACMHGSFCRPQGSDPEATEEAPGVCVPLTAAGEPCTLLYECDGQCIDGRCEPRPAMLCETLEAWWAARAMLG